MKMYKLTRSFALMITLFLACGVLIGLSAEIIHDAEFYILKGQNGAKEGLWGT